MSSPQPQDDAMTTDADAGLLHRVVMRSARSTVTLYHGDCRKLFPIEADAIVSDPPYGVSWDVGSKRKKSRGRYGVRVEADCKFDEIIGDDSAFDPAEILGLCVPTVLFGGNHFSDRLPVTGAWWVWDKRMHVASTDQSDCELCWTNIGNRARMIRFMYHGGLSIAKENGIKPGAGVPVGLHPTQKPVSVMRQIVQWLPDSVRVVCDPYMGSGSTGVACVREGLDFVGVEKDARYFKVAEERLKKELAQQRLF